ncbi:uncharacterized protein LOC123675990 isoform X3 [Harmonia axyridis]|uniref:uncharacterized protein LOC123675990 isoform X3 n=1 Tax=Harmonia axyridis TaxID=115357 RepID=UPI001E2768C5|nr:uncharacterized protein LOC123675990 isoform X3 [Harmonia axyridis]XP_045467564.1 uncharacterized protein LOC123675990 isoform X3 [Harmonia axyridis]XP_045467565.1 uncharacterized protein LOC123675990 isoform X3 [Harmonia axyridis]
MVMCWSPDCTHYNERETCKFFRFPKDTKTRNKWIRLIRRVDQPGPGAYVCSCHFLDGKKENGPKLFKKSEAKRFNFSDPEKRTRTKKDNIRSSTKVRFPTDLKIRHVWLKSLNIEEDEIGSQSLVCSGHFNSGDIIVAGKRRFLHFNAIPVSSKKENTNSLGLQEKDVLYHKDHDNIGEPKVKIETDETFFENQNTMRFEGCWIESSGSSTDTASPVNDQTLDIYEAKENFETSELVDNKNFLEIGPGPSESCEQNFSVPFNLGAPEVKIEVDESNESIAQILRLPFVPCTDTLETEVKTEPGLGVDESMPEVNDEGQDFKRDACSSFGEYVATELRSLPLEDRFQIQQEIQDCLSAAVVRRTSKLGASESTKVHNLPS